MEVVNELLRVLGKEEYSSLYSAFYKLEAIKSFFGNNKDLQKKDYIENLKKNMDDDSLNKAVELLRESISDAVSETFRQNAKNPRVFKIGYRFITGIGYPSPVENGMLLHHVYGIPYIHGESVKGLVRFMFCEKVALDKFKEEAEEDYDKFLKRLKSLIQKLENDEYKKDKGEDKEIQELYALLFGTKRSEGAIIYFDAYPESLKKENFVIDVMNSHYEKYYSTQGEKPPADWYNPTPIFFLALENVEFVFNIAYDPLKIGEEEGNNLLNIAYSCLTEGLEKYGLGAKKRKGYGWFKVFE
ncbi:type III-B CRISPR module RAMP protein Cmr6 [Hydrogenivirga sp.]